MDLLYARLKEREVEEADRFTISVATGTGIAWGGPSAYEAWLHARGKSPQAPDRPDDPVVARNMALAQLASMYPGRVKIAKAN